MRPAPGTGRAPVPAPRGSLPRAAPPRVPNGPDAPRTVVARRATPQAWAAFLQETARAAQPPPAQVPPARRRILRPLPLGGLLVTVALAGAALGLAPRTSAASPPWDLLDPPARHAAAAPTGVRTGAPTRTQAPFPGRVGPDVRQVVSVVAAGPRTHGATLRRWARDPDGTWHRVGAGARVTLGAGGLTWTPSDARPQTPVGTWGMDVVLARDPHVTRLPERVLRPGDGWSSCLTCADYDRLSRTGELWAGRNTWARVAIHLVTNPGRVRGRSSGIFLHVGTGGPTAGCIGATTDVVLGVARWLDPAAHPRVVIAVRP